MFIIRASNGTRAAFPNDLFDGAECRFLAAQTNWNVERIGLGTERHRAPALESGSAWTHIDLNTDLRNLAGKVRHFAGLRIDLDDRLITEIRRPNELAVSTIELPENAELSHLEK